MQTFQRATLRGLDETTPAAELPTDVRALLEHVAERLNLGAGMARLIVDFGGGRVKFLTRQERIKGTDVERFLSNDLRVAGNCPACDHNPRRSVR